MTVLEELKASLEKKKYRTRIRNQHEDFEIVEIRPYDFPRFLLSITKFVLERMNDKVPTKDEETFISWVKALNADDETLNKELFVGLYHFLNYYLDLDTEIFGDEDFTSSRNITIAWEDFVSHKIKEIEDRIEAYREGFEELPEENFDEPLSPKWADYDFSPKDPKGKMKTKAPFCPKCFHKLAKVMNLPPGSHSYELVWTDFNEDPLYHFCPKCGQRINWRDTPESAQPIEQTTWKKIKDILTRDII